MSVRMKAVSVRQPWAELIVLGLKDIENRFWRLERGGSFLVHAGKQYDPHAQWWMREMVGMDSARIAEIEDLAMARRGGLVGSMDVTGFVTGSKSRWFAGQTEPGKTNFGWQVGRVVRFPELVPCNGKLGIFVPDVDQVALARQFEAAARRRKEA